MKIKAVIWDLDETLWAGTLAEGDHVHLHESRLEVVKQLNQHGIVSALCSKNDYEKAKSTLQGFNVWDDFVFRRIDFVPKGDAVKCIVHDMQLRAENVLFVDDNHINLAEVISALPGIHTIDASSPQCDALLADLVHQNRHVDKSRLGEYRSLESRLIDSRSGENNRESFLVSCDINVSIIPRADNIIFYKRIEEIINRTNQLNYLKTRVAEGSIPDYLANVLNAELYSVAVWDKYGYHGIVGVVAVEDWSRLRHFAFSCRVMHMGIEEWVLAKLLERFTSLDVSPTGLTPKAAHWIKEVSYTEARDKIIKQEIKSSPSSADLRIMASCQSGAIAHYSGLLGSAEFDNAPRQFELCQVLRGSYREQGFPALIFYGSWTDYADPYWPKPFSLDNYRKAAREFVKFVESKGSRLLVAVPPAGLPHSKFAPDYGVTKERVKQLNGLWQEMCDKSIAIDLLLLDEIADPVDVLDVRHYSVTTLQKIGENLRIWRQGIVESSRPIVLEGD